MALLILLLPSLSDEFLANYSSWVYFSFWEFECKIASKWFGKYLDAVERNLTSDGVLGGC